MDILIPSHPRFNRNKGKNTQARKMWKPKETSISLIARTSLLVSSREDLCFDRECSRNMTREKNYLEELKP